MKVLVATAIYPTPEKPAFGTFVRTQVESLKRAGVEIDVLVLQGSSRKLMYPKAVLEVRRRLADNSINLIHAHYSYVGMVARTQWKVPVVVSYCGDDILGTINAQGKRTLTSSLIVRAGQMLSEHVDAVIVKSPEMASKLQRKDVHIIPHEVDFEVFKPVDRVQARATLGLDGDKKHLLFAANPQIAVKRFPLAQDVAEHLRRQDPSIELLVVYKEPQERLALYMSACDALIFPSYQEGSPNIVKQAMACNLPIVATDVGDVREIIGQTQGCYVCDPDVAQFAASLTAILQQRQRTIGREHVRHLDCPAVAQRVINVYEETLKRYRMRRRDAVTQAS